MAGSPQCSRIISMCDSTSGLLNSRHTPRVGASQREASFLGWVNQGHFVYYRTNPDLSTRNASMGSEQSTDRFALIAARYTESHFQ